MGKSSKKSDAKVAAAAPAPAVKPAKKGKRDAEEALKKLARAKKQKTEVKVEKKKAPPPKKVDSSSSEDDLSESEEEVKVPTKKDNKQAKTLANESSSSEESSSDEEIDAKASVLSKKLPATGAKNGVALVSKKKNESSDSSDSDSSSDDEPSSKKKPSLPVAKKQPESSDSSSGSDSSGDEEVMQAVVAKPSATVKPTVATSNVVPSSGLKKNESSDSESDDSSKDESDVKKVPVSVTPSKPNAKAVKKESSSDEDESEDEEDSSDDEPPKTQKNAMDTDVKMKDAQSEKKEPTTPSQIQPSGSKTLFVGNLSYDVDEDQISEFFEKAGEIGGVRLAKGEDGRFRGFGHVEFVTETAAQKAMEMNGETLLGRAVRLDLARERGAYIPQSGRESNSYQKGGQRQGQTIFVKGFDKSLGEDEVRSSLQDHFGSCGQISRLSIPPDRETGAPKGIAYIDFKDQDGASQALELNGSDLGGYTLTVDEAKPRGDSRDGGYSGGRGGGRGGRDSGGRGGRFGGRGRGRDGGGRGGRGRGGRGGRGTPNRQSFSAANAGKKTTFADD